MKKWLKYSLIGLLIAAIIAGLWYAYLKFVKFNSSKIQANITTYANQYGANSNAVAKMLTDMCNELLAFHLSEIETYATANNLSQEDALTTLAYNQLQTQGAFAGMSTTPPSTTATTSSSTSSSSSATS